MFNVILFETLFSTHTYSIENLSKLNHGDVIVAKEQSLGEGQFDRSWFSPVGNLYFTVVLKKLDGNLQEMLSISAEALISSLEKDYLIKGVERKLPNDILVNDKKICGILIKNVFQGESFEGMALSVGVNVNSTEEELAAIDQPATSLKVINAKEYDIEQVLESILSHLEAKL